SAQPFILERRELPEVLKGGYLSPRVPTEFGREIQPEGAARRGVEMPLHDLAHVGVELGLCFLRSTKQVFCYHTHLVISPCCFQSTGNRGRLIEIELLAS